MRETGAGTVPKAPGKTDYIIEIYIIKLLSGEKSSRRIFWEKNEDWVLDRIRIRRMLW